MFHGTFRHGLGFGQPPAGVERHKIDNLERAVACRVLARTSGGAGERTIGDCPGKNRRSPGEVGRKVSLSARAMAILDRMEPNCSYDVSELRAFAPELTLEAMNEVMRELWVARQVERAGYTGWRRERSSQPGGSRSHGERRSTARPKEVKPEDLFDHGAFEGFFK